MFLKISQYFPTLLGGQEQLS